MPCWPSAQHGCCAHVAHSTASSGSFAALTPARFVVDPCGYVTIDRARLQAGRGGDRAAGIGPRHCRSGRQRRAGLARQARVDCRIAVRVQGPERARWTLARAMITASDQMVTIEREPGREPLPRLELSAGAQTCWDGRFWVSVGADVETGAIEVRPLGEGAARELLQQGAVTTRVARAGRRHGSFVLARGPAPCGSLARILVRSELPQHPGSTICLERNREQIQALRPGKASKWCGNSGRR